MHSFLLLSLLPLVASILIKSSSTARPSNTAPAPAFLALASDSAKKDYLDIETNNNIPKGTKAKALLAWATRNGEPLLSAYKKYAGSVQQQADERNAKEIQIVSGLSRRAQAADSSIRAISNNSTLSQSQAEQQVNVRYSKVKPAVKKELAAAMNNATAGTK